MKVLAATSPPADNAAMYIYPAIDIRGGRCVRLVQGDYGRETVFGDPAAMARRWVEQGADRLHIVDLDGAKAGRPVNEEAVRQIVEAAGVPCQLGGGIRTDSDLQAVFNWGVRWAVLGTKAVQEPGWVRDTAAAHPDRIVLGLDARDGLVATDGWLTTSALRAIDLLRDVDHSPLFAVVYTDIATDGMLTGPNFPALTELGAATRLPVIASGGVANLDHVRRLAADGAFGCIVGRALYEGQLTLPDTLAAVRTPAGSQVPTPSTRTT